MQADAPVRLEYRDHRKDPAAWAAELGVSREAVELYLSSDVIDLHIDSFIWTRIFGYDLYRRHGHGLFKARFYSQVDLPRIREGGLTGAIWVITTNPLRGAEGRAEAFRHNLARLTRLLSACRDDVMIVKNGSEYDAARRAGKHAAFIGIQGGNALDRDGDAIELAGDAIVRVTLVHLSNSGLGATSAPGGDNGPLSDTGRAYVERLNARRIFVDLAHISRRGFFDALAVHDKSQPVIVTHTGVSGVHPHWRNLDDAQLRAVADTGGTVGVMFHSMFLGSPLWGGGTAARIVDHLEHIVRTVGEDHASLGSDWDGAIITPRDMPTCLELPRLVQIMLERGWAPARIQKVLGGNWLRTLRLLRP
jgi:membrane dipeptidase